MSESAVKISVLVAVLGLGGALLGVVSLGPDIWFLARVVESQNNQIVIQEQQRSLSREVQRNVLSIERVMENNVQAAQVVAEELNHVSEKIDTKFSEMNRLRQVDKLELQINALTQTMGIEQAELDRLARINNGNAANPPSPETRIAQDRAEQRMGGYENRMESLVRQLNRLMQ